MKKTVKAIRKNGAIEEFEKEVEAALNDGFDIKFSNAYVAGNDNRYYALLVKEESEDEQSAKAY